MAGYGHKNVKPYTGSGSGEKNLKPDSGSGSGAKFTGFAKLIEI